MRSIGIYTTFFVFLRGIRAVADPYQKPAVTIPDKIVHRTP